MRKPMAFFLPLLMFLRTAFIYAEDSGLPAGQTVVEPAPVADIHVVDPHGKCLNALRSRWKTSSINICSGHRGNHNDTEER